MRKVMGILIALFLLVAVADTVRGEKDSKSDPAASLDAGVIKEMHLEYKVNMAIPGRPMTVDISRTIKKAKSGKRPIWRIISTSETQMGTAVDTFEIDAKTLLPVSWRARFAQVSIEMNYRENAVKGSIDAGSGSVMPVDVSLEKPVLGDGSAFEVVLPALPLKKGYKTRIDMFDSEKQEVRSMALEVVGEETVTVPAGTFETIAVEMIPVDESFGGGMYYISLKDPRVLVRGVFQMPKEAGGGTVTSELAGYK